MVVVKQGKGGKVLARAPLWYEDSAPDRHPLIVIPTLYVEHDSAMAITTGTGLGVLFAGCVLSSPNWSEFVEAPSGFVGGSWMMWKTGEPVIKNCGFALWSPKFDIESAVRDTVRVLREHGHVGEKSRP